MAQLVKLEPGDILVLANLGSAVETDGQIEGLWASLTWLQEELQLGQIIAFEGDDNLSILPVGWTPDAVAGP